jgi:NAD(P)-dependent dehydrogenase (short-subunit alcohol dehydrogenase family)
MQKVILITGASSGLGKASAEYLSSLGHKVYGASRKPPVGPTSFEFLEMDVTNKSSIDNAINKVLAEEKRIDVLFNNAGMGIAGAIEDCSDEEIKLQFDTNFFGVLNVCKAIIQPMRANGGGLIINTSSLGGLMGLPFQGMYSATKFAIEGMSEALRFELKTSGIKVVLINPGDFSTKFTDNRKMAEKAQVDGIYRQQFLKTLKVIEHDERSGSDPIKIAKKVASIIDKKSPKVRYLVGNPEQIFFAGLRGVLPSKLFTWVTGSHYKI